MKVFKKYFTQQVYKTREEIANENDVVINLQACDSFRKNQTLCDKCFNVALLEKMAEKYTNEKRVAFMNYQVNLYSDPLQWLKEAKDFLFEVTPKEGYLEDMEHAVYMQICDQGIAQLSKAKEDQSQPSQTKLIWRKSPELFYVLFSALYEEGFFNLRSGNNDEKPVAEILYKAFQVNAKIGEKQEHSQATFLQHFKSSSQLQTDIADNIALKNNIVAFLKNLDQ